jgi:hypothetical protein
MCWGARTANWKSTSNRSSRSERRFAPSPGRASASTPARHLALETLYVVSAEPRRAQPPALAQHASEFTRRFRCRSRRSCACATVMPSPRPGTEVDDRTSVPQSLPPRRHNKLRINAIMTSFRTTRFERSTFPLSSATPCRIRLDEAPRFPSEMIRSNALSASARDALLPLGAPDRLRILGLRLCPWPGISRGQ